MRIIVLSTSFPLTSESSSGVFVRRLLDHISKDADVTLLTPSPAAPIPEVQPHAPFKVTCFRYAPQRMQILAHRPGGIPATLEKHRWAHLLLPLFILSMLFRTCRLAMKADVLHANWAANGIIAGIAGLLTKTPVVTTLRGSDMIKFGTSALNRRVFRFLLWSNCKIICVSRAIHDKLVYQFNDYAYKIAMIPNGVDDTFLDIPPANYCSSRQLRLITVGSLISRKQIDVILKAMAHSSIFGKARLTIVGDGPEDTKLRKIVKRLALSRYVTFAGSIPPEKISKILQGHDVLILASRLEGRPNVVLEAMASGRAVIASNIEGVNELIKHNETGLLFDEGDAQALASCIAMLWKHPYMIRKFALEARKYIIENGLIWKESASAYLKIYQDCLHPHY